MKGLELSRRFFEELALPRLEREEPDLLARAAFGLAGEGSECLGFDDELSRDHDWGPGFCIWLDAADMASLGDRAAAFYASLPRAYLGCERLRETAETAGRVGVRETGAFYRRYLGLDRAPRDLNEWFFAPEEGLSTAVSGAVFRDDSGAFTAIRREILAYYPEDIRLKKLAGRCALAAQAGQYNYPRCLRRGEGVAAMLALSQFAEQAMRAVFLLNRRYMPYYKWAHRALRELPILGAETAPLFADLAATAGDRTDTVEAISALLIAELKREGLTAGEEDFLLPHAERVQEKIGTDALRRLHLMAV